MKPNPIPLIRPKVRMKIGVLGEIVEVIRAHEVIREPVMYVKRRPNLFEHTAANGMVINTKPLSNEPTKDITPVPSSKCNLRDGSITPKDNVIAALMRLPTKQATQTSQPQPPSGGWSMSEALDFVFLLAAFTSSWK